MTPEFPTSHVDWSYSIARQYQSCPRQFYYQNSREEGSNNYTHKQYSSDSIQPPRARLGTVVHACIEEKITCWQKGTDKSLRTMQQAATQQLQQYFNQHEDAIKRLHLSSEDEDNIDDLIDSLTHIAQDHLKTFFRVIWPKFNSHRYITHEETTSFEVDDHTVWVRPDLCTRDQTGDFVVTDWKTGSVSQLENSTMQSLVYALWAYQEYEPDLNRILVQRVHTGTGEIDRMRPDREDIISIKTQIREDREDWTTLRNIDGFQPDPTLEKCNDCAYLSRCSAGQDLV